MSKLKNLLTSLFLGIFCSFLLGANFVVALEKQDGTIITTGISSTCSSNIQCEEVDTGIYSCQSAGEISFGSGFGVSQIPVGKFGTTTTHIQNPILYKKGQFFEKQQHIYVGQGVFVYPFVRITKIQV